MQNKIMKLLLAMIAIICTCIAVFFTLTEEVPVLKNSVTAGTVITPENITNRRIVKTAHKNAIREDKYAVGKVATIDIPANTPFPLAVFSDNAVEGENAFTIGINTIGIIVHVTYENGYLAKVDVELPKEDAVRTVTAISVGETYIVKNFDMNEIKLSGITARDLFLENFLATAEEVQVVEDNNGNPLVNLVDEFNEENGIGGGH